MTRTLGRFSTAAATQGEHRLAAMNPRRVGRRTDDRTLSSVILAGCGAGWNPTADCSKKTDDKMRSSVLRRLKELFPNGRQSRLHNSFPLDSKAELGRSASA